MADNKSEILFRIEAIILKILYGLVNDNNACISYPDLNNSNNCVFSDRLISKPTSAFVMQEVNFGNIRSRHKFSVIIYILSKIYMMLQRNLQCTSRELYYENTDFFKNQRVVSSAIRVVCSLIHAAPWEVGIIATAKGLIAGPLTMYSPNRNFIDCSKGILIPQNLTDYTTIKSSAKYVLLIEKDATFQKLISENFLTEHPAIILITGKGYPDISTRLLVKKINDHLHIPIYALMDADPHGISIMCVYRFGSLSMCSYSNLLATPDIKWLGIHPSDLVELGVPTSPLTKRDTLMLQSLTKKSFISNNINLFNQVNTLLKLNKKCEIEDLGLFSSCYLTDVYIPSKLARTSTRMDHNIQLKFLTDKMI